MDCDLYKQDKRWQIIPKNNIIEIDKHTKVLKTVMMASSGARRARGKRAEITQECGFKFQFM